MPFSFRAILKLVPAAIWIVRADVNDGTAEPAETAMATGELAGPTTPS